MNQAAQSPHPSYAPPTGAPGPTPWQLREVWVRWVGIVVLATVAVLTADHRNALPLWQNWLLVFLGAALNWNGNVLIFYYLRRRLPAYEQTGRRVLLHVLLAVAFTAAATLLTTWKTVHFASPSLAYWPSYWRAFQRSLLTAVVITSVYESVYFFYEWRRYYLRAAGFEAESAVARFEALKQQVDPHFLFNSLNTMAALIGDNEPAQAFLGNLADVYRYVLLSKASATVPLSQEMTFVEAYLYLNHIRFGDTIQVVTDIAPEALRLHVPPLVVQLLVENALKHNAVSRQAPLRITIRAAERVLSVSNTIHRKTILEKSTRQGLQNIVNRYQFITDRPVAIENRGREFEVILPLLPAA